MFGEKKIHTKPLKGNMRVLTFCTEIQVVVIME